MQCRALCLLLVIAWSQTVGCALARSLPEITLGLVLQRELLVCSSDCIFMLTQVISSTQSEIGQDAKS